ncbi:MAG: hypothetical protein WDA75_07840 [Candidatus Latescibacterota bacterium]|jgi:hypothetical protein
MRWIAWLFMLFVYCSWPAPVVAARLDLRPTGQATASTSVQVGQELEIVLWVDSEGQSLSGAAVFLSFDESVFELVDQDRAPAVAGYQPFTPGTFLGNGEIYRNDRLAEDDPAAAPAGAQLDYSVVRATDRGAGAIASFRLRARAPTRQATVRIDESGTRETRVFLPDGSHDAFRFINPLQVTVQGITLSGLPDRLVLVRGQVDLSTFRLSHLVYDPLYPAEKIAWSVSPTRSLEVTLQPDGPVLRVAAPTDASAWERLVLTATNPDGQSASDTVEVFVDAPPVASRVPAALELREDEAYALTLDGLVEDADTPDAQLRWTAAASPQVQVALEGPPHRARITGQPDWSGSGWLALTVTDEYGFSDTAQVEIRVTAVNDPPRFLAAPNLTLIEGRRDSSLAVADLAADIEGGVRLSWSGSDRVTLEERQGRLVVGSAVGFTGTEQIQLRAEDPEGLTATAPLTVTVVPSLPPTLVGAPDRRGMTAGDHFVLALDELVVDPDDSDEDLTWAVAGQQELRVLLSTARAARVEAPATFTGTETLTFTVADPAGRSASFDLVVFSAQAAGGPVIASLPGLTLPVDGVDASLDLDDYLYDPDDDPAAIQWYLPSREDLSLKVDPVTRVLTVTPTAVARAGALSLEVRAADPAGHEAVQTLEVVLTGAAGEPTLSFALLPLGPVELASGGTWSGDLDSLVSGSLAPGLIAWQAEPAAHLYPVVDAATHLVVVIPSSGWSGTEEVTFVASHGDLPSQRLTLEITVAPAVDPTPVGPLVLPALTEIPLFSGEAEITVDVASLLGDSAADDDLTWQVTGSRPVQATYEAATGLLTLKTESGWHGDEELTLQVSDGAGHQADGRLLLQVHPADGTVGEESDDLQLAVIPNPVQREYLDVYVLASTEISRTPLLRLQDETWHALAMTVLAPGLWHGTHALRPGQQGEVQLVALCVTPDARILRSLLSLEAGSPAAKAGTSPETRGEALSKEVTAAGDGPVQAAIATETGRVFEPVGE